MFWKPYREKMETKEEEGEKVEKFSIGKSIINEKPQTSKDRIDIRTEEGGWHKWRRECETIKDSCWLKVVGGKKTCSSLFSFWGIELLPLIFAAMFVPLKLKAGCCLLYFAFNLSLILIHQKYIKQNFFAQKQTNQSFKKLLCFFKFFVRFLCFEGFLLYVQDSKWDV